MMFRVTVTSAVLSLLCEEKLYKIPFTQGQKYVAYNFKIDFFGDKQQFYRRLAGTFSQFPHHWQVWRKVNL